MTSIQEKEATLALLLHAAFADGAKSDAERALLRQMAQTLSAEGLDLWAVYQQVLGGSFPVEQAVARLQTSQARTLAYEMAVGVCDTDGAPNEAERRFLDRLREALGQGAGLEAVPPVDAGAQQLLEALPVPTAVAASAAAAAPRRANVDTAALDQRILNYAILTGALEMLPQSLATMAVVPLQMKLVYSISKDHGYTLDRGHIRDFMATAGAGLAAQAVEGYARKLLGGLAGGLLGGGLLGGLGRGAVGVGTGAALTFGSTYALGTLAVRYYGGGRTMEVAVLKDTFATLRERGTALFTQNRAAVEQRAATLSPSEVLQWVKQ